MLSKIAALIMLSTFASFSWGQGLIFETIDKKPSHLRLQKHGSQLVHMEKSPEARVATIFMGASMGARDWLVNGMNAQSEVLCDGNFELAKNAFNQQFLKVNTISVCVDENGFVVVHSVGVQLKPEEIQKKALALNPNAKVSTDPSVNSGNRSVTKESVMMIPGMAGDGTGTTSL